MSLFNQGPDENIVDDSEFNTVIRECGETASRGRSEDHGQEDPEGIEYLFDN